MTDGQIAVDRQTHQIQNGRRAEHDVERRGHQTEIAPQMPGGVVQLLVDGEGHDHQRHQEVGARQRHDERVGDRLELPEHADGGHDHDVADQSGENDDGQKQTERDAPFQRVEKRRAGTVGAVFDQRLRGGGNVHVDNRWTLHDQNFPNIVNTNPC